MRMPAFSQDEPELNVSSLIDMVFLLLVYFMATASLVRSEADLGIRLPGMLAQAETVEMNDEQMIEVRSTGRVVLNGQEYDDPAKPELPQLATLLTRYRLASEAAKSEPYITIWAEDEAQHQRVIDVMNACAIAGIKNVTFASSLE